MLIDILRMPPVFGVPIDRRLTVYACEYQPHFTSEPSVHWPHMPLYNDVLYTGSCITVPPENIFKAIHISDDNLWVFETVFAQMQDDSYSCLYTKVIGNNSVAIGISLRSIDFYRTNLRNTIPLSQFVGRRSEGNTLSTDLVIPHDINPVEYVIPPVFGEKELWGHLQHLLDVRGRGFTESRLGWSYRPIWEHVPSVMEALIEGYFARSPLFEVRYRHPNIDIPHDKWFLYEHQAMLSKVLDHTSFVNHKAFDSIVLDIVELKSTRLNITCLMSYAIEGSVIGEDYDSLYSMLNHVDDYALFLHGMRYDKSYRPQKKIEEIFYRCVMVYCQLFSVDYQQFLDRDSDKSSVTISKNIYDEVTITFHDVVNGDYTCFYSTFPAIALATLSAGNY
jgi:hypothetical protein